MFDYIIVGAGSAGCVLANRLSADPACRVLLLEAGGKDDAAAIHTPACYAQLQDSVYDWSLRSVPQKKMYGRRIFLPQGRVLGGSSSINYMIYMRGNRKDYDYWQQLGNHGWNYAGVLPYFIKAEDNQTFFDQYHGNSGPLSVTSPAELNPLVARYFSAAQAAGIPFNSDFNGENQQGVGPMQATINKGSRCSAASAYLFPVLGRANLTVLTHTYTTELLLAGTRAVGVEYICKGHIEKAYADAEVIVSSGAIHSPQLLMLSGIGAKTELESLGIKVQVDLPGVGKNLQDHLHTRVRCEISEGLIYAPFIKQQSELAKQNYERYKGGPLASNFLEAGAFVNSHQKVSSPDLQLFFLMALPADYPEAGATMLQGVTLTAYINRPKSRGTVYLASRDPLDRPQLDFNYLSHDDDLRCAVAGVRWNLKILYGAAFDDIRGNEVAPGIHVRSEDELENFVRRTASTTWHPCGTCKMGNDKMAVVDDQLRVYGIGKLRVIDASIMPTIVSGNTNAPTIMIAEKGADLIS